MASRSKTDIWMPLYIGDYLADTAHLTTEQSGAYLHLLMHYWKTGPLPNNNLALAQITKLSADAWSIAQVMLRPFFMVNGDGKLHQKRIDEELKGWGAKKLSAKEKAAKAASARWKKDAPSIPPSNTSSTPQAMLGSCPSSSSSQEEIKDPSIASRFVLEKCGLSKTRAFLEAVGDQAKMALDSGESLVDWGEAAVKAYLDYQEARSRLEYPCGAERFFSTGLYRHRENWQYKEGQAPKNGNRKYYEGGSD